MSLKFYLDEDAMRHSLLRALRSRHVDVNTAFDEGLVSRPDEEGLELATVQERVLFSFNVAHFCRLHSEWLAAGRAHCGIVVSQQQRYKIGTSLRGLLKLASQRDAASMRNRRWTSL